MKILAIESSCDETSAAVVENGVKVLSNVIASQAPVHAKTGGVVPEVAAREHVNRILPVVEKALTDAGVRLEKIDALAVTYGPGLSIALVIGTSVANALAMAVEKPLIGVRHIYGHVYAPWLEAKKTPQFPILSLSVSGGHNELFLMKEHHEFEILAETADDAAGEAFDKVARMLGLSYPGGPVLEALAKKGNREAFSFPRAVFSDGREAFSFSGLKTAVLYHLEKNKRRMRDKKFLADTAASFQKAVIDALTSKLFMMLDAHNDVKEIHLTGGVSANMALRDAIERALKVWNKENGMKIAFRVPVRMSYCTDNAAMIGAAAYFQYQKSSEKYREWKFVEARAGF
jgi:N6-L-threonylcarbamoyladenine synthase